MRMNGRGPQQSLMMSDDAIKCFLVTNIFGISFERDHGIRTHTKWTKIDDLFGGDVLI